MEKADPRKGYQNPKRKLGVTTHFSEIIELNFVKKLPYILCIFLFHGIPITLAKIRFFPIVVTFAKIHLSYAAPSLIFTALINIINEINFSYP